MLSSELRREQSLGGSRGSLESGPAVQAQCAKALAIVDSRLADGVDEDLHKCRVTSADCQLVSAQYVTCPPNPLAGRNEWWS